MWFNKNIKMCDIDLNEFLKSKKISDKISIKTPLVKIENLSKKLNKLVLLKDETNQIGKSFKIRGVFNSVYNALINIKKENTSIITQSTGNHAIATLISIKFLIKNNLDNKLFNTIIPVIYGTKNINKTKLKIIKFELNEIRKLVKDQKRGKLDFSFNSYNNACIGREEYIKKNNSIYISHGGKNIFLGHGSIGIEINNQLNNLKISKDKKITIILSSGAGGIIGIGASLSLLRNYKNVDIIATQTDDQNALIKSLIEKKIIYNDSPRLNFADGIAVNCPEKYSFEIIKNIIKYGITIPHEYCLKNTLQNLKKDIQDSCKYNILLGGTTMLGFSVIEKHINLLKDTDIIIILACEGNL